MGPQAAEELQTLAHARGESLALLATLSQRELDARPDASGWSAGEVFDHVCLAEGFFRESISRLIEQYRRNGTKSSAISLAELNVRPAFVPELLLPFFECPLTLSNMFILRQLVPRQFIQAFLATPFANARHPDVADPRPRLPKSQLTHQLEHGLAATKSLLADNSDIAFEELRISHPILGVNSIRQLLEIMATHELGHLRKLKARLTQAPQPAYARTATTSAFDDATMCEPSMTNPNAKVVEEVV